jgi:putative ABC transport system permease protein
MNKELTVGNYYVKSVQSFSDIQEQHEFSEGITNQYRLNLALGIFFLVNLCLGVAGTFWMQTRSRREEVGIMLSFGGTPSHITRLLLYEGWILTTLGTLTGCLLYLQYALRDGLYTTCNSAEEAMPAYWINHFGLHFTAVTLIVYLLLLIVVSIGIWMPAHKLSRISPVDALRDE